MKVFLCEAHKWHSFYNNIISNIAKNFACALAFLHLPSPVCTTIAIPNTNQMHLATDVAYFYHTTFLHIIHYRTKWSQTGIVWTRRLQNYINDSKSIQIYWHGIPNAIWGDQKVNLAEPLHFCS